MARKRLNLSSTRFADKLYKQMLNKGLNQQRLANASRVSDSEVSRILANKSQPGLENAFRLARAVGVSLDYLADDDLEVDPLQPGGTATAEEHQVLELAKKVGASSTVQLLTVAQVLGFDVAIRRLVGAEMKPLVELGDNPRTAPAAPAAAAPKARAGAG